LYENEGDEDDGEEKEEKEEEHEQEQEQEQEQAEATKEPAVQASSLAATKEPEPAVEAEAVQMSEPTKEPLPQPTQAQQAPMIYIDTKPSVTFSNEHVMFDSDNLENNEIQDIPFAGEEDDDAIDSVLIMDEVLPMDSDEVLM